MAALFLLVSGTRHPLLEAQHERQCSTLTPAAIILPAQGTGAAQKASDGAQHGGIREVVCACLADCTLLQLQCREDTRRLHGEALMLWLPCVASGCRHRQLHRSAHLQIAVSLVIGVTLQHSRRLTNFLCVPTATGRFAPHES